MAFSSGRSEHRHAAMAHFRRKPQDVVDSNRESYTNRHIIRATPSCSKVVQKKVCARARVCVCVCVCVRV